MKCFYQRIWSNRTTRIFTVAFLLLPAITRASGLIVAGVQVATNGTITFSYPSDPNYYYILYRGALNAINVPTQMQLGREGTNSISDTIGTNSTGFFRIRQVPISQPLDTDGDGIDDVYELLHPGSLNPLNASDAAQHYNGDSLSNLKEYQDSLIEASALTINNWRTRFSVSDHVLAIREDGTLWAWGWNADGQLGDGSTDPKTWPVQIGTDADWIAVSAGAQASMALKSDGTIWAWGNNSAGYLGLGYSSGIITTPTQVLGGPWAYVACGDRVTFGIKNDGTLWRWGSTGGKSPLQLGTDTNWKAVYPSQGVFVGIKTDGTLWSWNSTLPTQLGTNTDWVGAAAPGLDYLALEATGRLIAWGPLNQGQFGNPNVSSATFSAPVELGSNWKTISSAGNGSGCVAVRNDGTLWGWGRYWFPNAPSGAGSVPTQIGSDNDWVTASCEYGGYYYAVAVKQDGTIWAIGSDPDFPAQVATNGTPDFLQVGNDYTWAAVSADGTHTLALKQDHSLWTWGNNGYGQLGTGIGTISDQLYPIQVGTNVDWQQISTIISGSIFSYSLAMNANSNVWAWGPYINGILGGNAEPDLFVPTIVTSNIWVFGANNSNAMGRAHSLQIRTNGTLYAWGTNNLGQVGNNSTNSVAQSNAYYLGSGFQSVFASNDYSLALTTNGTVYAWGSMLQFLGASNATYSPYFPVYPSAPVQISAAFWALASNYTAPIVAQVGTDGSLFNYSIGYIQNTGNSLGDWTLNGSISPVPIVAYPPSRQLSISGCVHRSRADWQELVREEILADTGGAIDMNRYFPEDGFMANKQYVQETYAYYQSLYYRNPNAYLWPGLAKMAGGPVYAALSDAQNAYDYSQYLQYFPGFAQEGITIADDALEAVQMNLLLINQSVFEDIAWQWKAYDEGGLCAIQYIYQTEGSTAVDLTTWELIDAGIRTGDPLALSRGNLDIAYREQSIQAQPYFTDMADYGFGVGGFVGTQLAVSPIPGDPGFTYYFEGGLVTDFGPRWAWISEFIWPRWTGFATSVRNSFVFESLFDRAALCSYLYPHGAPIIQ